MSRFFSEKYQALTPYVPGEQPRDQQYIKLNTNESPFPPPPLARKMAAEAAGSLQLYSDPEGTKLRAKLAEIYHVGPEQVILGNGSDELLNFAFAAFCDGTHPACFADITYGFYPVFAKLNGVPYREIPLRADFTVNAADYETAAGMVFLANPNAPTGLALPVAEIARIAAANPDRVVVVDEAYVDFGGESAIPLIRDYDNLLVVRTFSKSRSLAGARLGFAIGNQALITDLNTLRNSSNPYNVNAMTLAAGLGSLLEDTYNWENCRRIVESRQRLTGGLRALGFTLNDSATNFVFATHPRVGGRELYLSLRQRGILVRHFAVPRIENYIRITVGTHAEVETLLAELKAILEEI